ncbi:MAG: hypothetical protein ACJ74W_11020 [Pyrinomonadaceae bacterium]
MSHLITLIEGSSTASEVVQQAHMIDRVVERVVEAREFLLVCGCSAERHVGHKLSALIDEVRAQLVAFERARVVAYVVCGHEDEHNLHGLAKRVADDGDAIGVGGFLFRVLAGAQALTVDPHVGRALFAKPAGDVGAQCPARLLFKGVEVRIRGADDTQPHFGQAQRTEDAAAEEQALGGPAFVCAHAVRTACR